MALTGVSGSGKSTLAFDILFAEGQRRYLESLAPYVRQYMKVLERPDVDLVTGLSPTVAIEQRISHASRRSTVATLTEIYHFLRLLFSKAGRQHCPGCDRPLETWRPQAIRQQVKSRFAGKKGLILATKVAGRKGFHKDVLAGALKKGFDRARIDGRITRLVPGMALSRYHEHTIEVVVGRVTPDRSDALVDRAIKEGKGSLIVTDGRGDDVTFSVHGVCPTCGMGLPPLDPRLFSFNSSQGACPVCHGLGLTDGEDNGDETPGASCGACRGSRLRPEALAVRVNGHNIWDLVRLPAGKLASLVAALDVAPHQRAVAEPVKAEVGTRLRLMERLGLGYLSLSRSGRHPFRRRGPAGTPGCPARFQSYRCDLCLGRAHHRTASQGQPDAHQCPGRVEGSGEHGFWWWSTMRRPSGPPTISSTWGPGPARTAAGWWPRGPLPTCGQRPCR